jgi:peptide/nickel transport system substrate-binding protein
VKIKLSLILLAAMITGCFNRVRTPSDTLIVGLASAPSTLDPRFATDANGMRVGGLIFNSLVKPGDDFKPMPDAAASWTYKNHVFTFELKPDLTFHNGRKVTPEDLEFSFEQFRAKNSPFASILDLIKKVEAEDAGGHLRLRIYVKNFSDKFLVGDLPSVKIIPKKEVLEAGPEFHKVLIGTGGFRFLKQNLNEIQLQSVSANVDKLVFKVIRDDFTRYQKMMKGELDLVQADLPLEKIAAFEKLHKDFQVFKYPGLTMTYVLVNFRDPVLKQLDVRQALNLCIDRSLIIKHKLHGMGIEATSLLTPPNPYFNPTLKNPSSDWQAAHDLIAEKGLAGHELILKTSNTPQAIDNGKVLAYQMSRSGLKVKLQSYEWATFYDDVKKGNFQLATMRWVGTLDPDLYRIAFHSKELPPGRNRGAYNNPKLDKLLEASATVESVEQRKRLLTEVQEIVFKDLAIIPLWYDQQVAVARKNIHDYQPVQSGDFWPLLKVRKSAP